MPRAELVGLDEDGSLWGASLVAKEELWLAFA
jgi:hypothetical protein